MANDKNTTPISSKCSVCGQDFTSVQACLKHELIKHCFEKKDHPNSNQKKIINAATKFLNSEEKLTERERLDGRLKNCKNGEELATILEMFSIDDDSLDLIYTRVLTSLKNELKSIGVVKIYPFGSIASGLALRDCDIDIFMDTSDINFSPKHKRQKEERQIQQKSAFNRINQLLYRSPDFSDIFAIRKARVPIIKCKHNDTGFSIDINVSCPSSTENTQFIHQLVKSDKRIHELMLFLKLWAKNMHIIGRGNMTSYCLITMVIFFLQQPLILSFRRTANCKILKSIKELQENCAEHIVQGVNYAYDLSSPENQPEIPTSVTTLILIKEFFKFYKGFNFENNVISPYYGRSVERTNLTPDICTEYYRQLNTITQYLEGNQANHLQIDRAMCVQDAFCLNQNTAKNLSPQSKQYFILCLQNAHELCNVKKNLKISDLYKKLLYETIAINNDPTVNNIKLAVIDFQNLEFPAVETNDRSLYTLIPSKTDLHILAANDLTLSDNVAVLRCWCKHYFEAIETIIVKLYRMDMQEQQAAAQKQQKLEKDSVLDNAWLISGTVDLWTNRCFQKHLQTSFMAYQLEQTERLYNLRRQDPKFSVTLNAVLKLNVCRNYMGIDIHIDLPEGASLTSLSKKSPLRKFFNMFKNTLQNYNLKESLKINDTKISPDTSNATTAAKNPKNE